MARDAAYEALLDRLSTALPDVEWTRRPIDWSQSNTSNPRGLMLTATQTPENEPGKPSKWRYQADCQIWVTDQGDAAIQSDTVLNGYMDAVGQALMLQPDESAMSPQTTLGGAVQSAWLSGQIEFADGSNVQQTAAIFTIEMLVAG